MPMLDRRPRVRAHDPAVRIQITVIVNGAHTPKLQILVTRAFFCAVDRLVLGLTTL